MRRRNPYLLLGLAFALIAYILVTRPTEGLEVKSKEDTTAKPPATDSATTGMMPSLPCQVSGLTSGAWAHKESKTAGERYTFSTALGNSSSPSDCGTKCCSDNKCTAFTHFKPQNVCWMYYDDPSELEDDSNTASDPNFQKGTVDRSGGLSDLTNKLSGGLTQTMDSVSGVLGSSLSTGAIVGIILAVLAIGIPLAVYGYRFFGGRTLSASSVSVGNPVTRMKLPVAK